jgi:hypothetical protein
VRWLSAEAMPITLRSCACALAGNRQACCPSIHLRPVVNTH